MGRSVSDPRSGERGSNRTFISALLECGENNMTDRSSSPTMKAADWLSQFAAALDQKDWPGAVSLFCDECYWRDLVAFTWNIKTLEGRDDIQAMLAATVSSVHP